MGGDAGAKTSGMHEGLRGGGPYGVAMAERSVNLHWSAPRTRHGADHAYVAVSPRDRWTGNDLYTVGDALNPVARQLLPSLFQSSWAEPSA